MVAVPMVKQRVITVPPVGNHDAEGLHVHIKRGFVARHLPIRNVHEFRQEAVVVKERVHLYGPILRCVMCLVIYREGQGYKSGVKQPYRHLETELSVLPLCLLAEMPMQYVYIVDYQ